MNKVVSKNPEWFEEFYRSYPCKTTRPNGTVSYLRGNIQKCKKLYYEIVGEDKKMKNLLLTCLLKEESNRLATGSMPWMRLMYNWLKEEEWKQWMEDDKSSKQEVTVQYGTDVK